MAIYNADEIRNELKSVISKASSTDASRDVCASCGEVKVDFSKSSKLDVSGGAADIRDALRLELRARG